MGQKINPIGFRLGVQRNWSSKWYAVGRNFYKIVLKNMKVQEGLKKRTSQASL